MTAEPKARERLGLQRFICGLVFLALVAEPRVGIYDGGKWQTFMVYAGDVLFFSLPGIRMPLLDVFLLGAMIAALRSRGAALWLRARPMDAALKLSLVGVGAMYTWGLVRGGDLKLLLFQTQWFVMMSVLAIAMIAAFSRAAHFTLLGKAILAAAAYRSAMVWIFYLRFVRTGIIWPAPPTITTHHDSALFVLGLVIALSYALSQRTAGAWLFAALSSALFLTAIEWNGRRLAYLSLIASLGLIFFILPERPARRRALFALAIATPLLVAYVAAGWGRTEPIFKPVYSFASVIGESEDTSSEMRNIEHYNLVRTFRTSMLVGTGFGHEYTEVSRAYDITHAFPWYRYVPHNNVIGLLAFTGIVGFVSIWLVIPVTLFLAARTRRLSEAPVVRAAASSAAAAVLVYMVHMYGDMGFSSVTTCILLASAVAVAGRLSAVSGAWPVEPPAAASEPRRQRG